MRVRPVTAEHAETGEHAHVPFTFVWVIPVVSLTFFRLLVRISVLNALTRETLRVETGGT